MTLRDTQCALLGAIVAIFVAVACETAYGQQSPPPAAKQTPPTTQPARNPESQEALEKLLKLRDEMQRAQEERERAQPAQEPNAPPGQSPATQVNRRQPPRRPASQQPGEETASPPAAGEPASETQTHPRTPPPQTRSLQEAMRVPADFVGPPEGLASKPPPAAPRREPGESRPAAEPSAETEASQAAPEPEPAVTHRPITDEDGEWFQFVNTPWEDVIHLFVERIGKPLLQEDVGITGELTYQSNRTFTKEEAVDELNLILHEKGYRFVEEEHHIKVVTLSEMPQKVELKYVFPTVAAFEQANPRDMDYVTVYYQVADRSAEVYRTAFERALPDYSLMEVLPDSNQLKINALARDVRKFLTLKDRIDISPTDIRKMRIFDIKTNAMDIEQRVRQFLELRAAAGAAAPSVQMVRDPRTGRMVPQAAPQPAPPTPTPQNDVQMVADERTNSIIVKATDDKIEEISKLIETLDQKPPIGEFRTEVVEVKHADATQVAQLLNQILQQEQGQASARTPGWQQQMQMQQWQQQIQAMQRRGRAGQPPQPPQPIPQPAMMQMGGVAPEDIILEGAFERAKKTIRLVADSRTNSLIVYANDEGFKRVEKMLEIIDKPQPDNFQTYALAYGKVADIAPLLTQLVSGLSQTGAAGGRTAASVVPDEINNVFYVFAERDQMERIAEFINQLDVPPVEQPRHIVELKNLQPSQVASMVQALLAAPAGGGGATPSVPRLPRGGRLPSGSSSATVTRGDTYQVIPLDEAQILIVLCSDEDWAKVEQTIQLWDERALSNSPRLETFTIEKGNAQTIANTLTTLYRNYKHPVLGASPVTMMAEGNVLHVHAIQPALDEIAALLPQLDVESMQDKVEILPLANADAATLATQAQGLFTPRAGGPRGGSGTPAPLIQAEPITNALIVQGDKADVEKLKLFAMQMDQRIGAQGTEQRFYELKHARPQDVANTIQSVFGSTGGAAKGRAVQVRAMAAGAQVIVEAPKEKFASIEAFLKQLDDPKGKEIKTQTVKLAGADVAQIAQTLTTTLKGIPRPDGLQAVIVPDVGTESLIVTAPADMFPKIDELVAALSAGIETLALERAMYPVKIADAGYVADLLQKQLVQQVQKTKGQNVANQISINVDTRQNQVIINAPRFVHPIAADLIAALDREDTTETPPEIIALKYIDPNQMVQTINAMYGARGGQGRNAQQDVQATVSNGQLVLRSASKKRLEEVRALVAALDSQDKTALQVRTYPLRVLNAAAVATQVQMYLRSISAVQRTGGLQPGAFGEPTTNTLVVIAPAEQLPYIEGLIQQLDPERPESGAKTYVLKNARADQVAQNVDTMLKAKVADREGARKALVQTSVIADTSGNRLFVFAPPEYQDLAQQLITMVDEEVDTGELVHIVPLDKGDATQVAQSLDKVMQGAAGGKGARVRITADPSSNSLLLSGLPRDVATAEKLVSELETNSTAIPELQMFKLQHATVGMVEDTLKGLYGKATNPQDVVTVTADEYSGRLMVTANRRKMRHIETIIAELDQAPSPEDENLVEGGRQVYLVDINRGSATDIVWNVRDMFPGEKHGGPIIDSDWFDQYIIVKCRPSEFPKIEKWIREFERRAKVEVTQRFIRSKGNTDALLEYIAMRDEKGNTVITRPDQKPKIETLKIDVWGPDEEPEEVKAKRESNEKNSEKKSEKGGRALLPFQSGLSLSRALLDDIEQDIAGVPVRPGPAPRLTGRVPWRIVPSFGFRPVAFASGAMQDPPRAPARPASTPSTPPPVAPPPTQTKAEEKSDEPGGLGQRIPSPVPKEPLRVHVQPDGTLMLEGPRDEVDDVVKAVELFQEERSVGEVIRVFRFKYGDVTAAAEILNIMFNERQILIPQQPQQPQRPRGGQQGEESQGGRGQQQQQGGLFDQFRSVVGGRPQQEGQRQPRSQALRIATDPGHNYLIIKCNETDLAEIHQLLRELDIPPGEVQIRVFQLEHLAAEETAENIKDVLGISKVQQRRGGGRQPATPGRPGQQPGGAQQAQLIEMLQQQLVSVPGVEGGAKVERVEIVPNSITNSLLVSAPPEVMTLIERVINEVEELGGRDVVGIHHYALQQAKLDDLLPLLQEIFQGAEGGGGARPGGRLPGAPRTAGGSPAALGPVTISGDPRTNTVIFTAEAKDVPTIEKQIERLDITGAVAEAETYVCRYGNAEAIAAVVESIFVTGSAGRAPAGGPRGGGATATTDLRIAAEPATNTILVWGPLDKRDLVFAKIEELDKLNARDIREISVVYADPEKIAATLSDVFVGGGSATPGGRTSRRTARPAGGGAAGPSVTNTGHVMIFGDKSAKKLLVRAPDEIFKQIEALVATLDQPSQDMQLKRFQLRYADAEGVVESVKQALTEYMQLAKNVGTETDFDAFTAVPDTRTNTVTVVGSERTFLFVQQILAAVDVPTPDDQRKEFRIFMLEKANAATVADAINGFATGGAGATGAGRGGGRRSGGTPGAPAGGQRELNVYAVAEEATNSVLVFGKPDDIDVVELAVIEKLEESISGHLRVDQVAVKNVPPSEIVSFISMFLSETGPSSGGGPGGRGGRAGEQTGPQIVPNDGAKTLVVRGTRRQINEVRDLVERFDDPQLVRAPVDLIEIPLGQDARALATEVERVINQNEEQMAQATGRQARRIVVGADEATNTLILAGDPSIFGMARSIVDQLTDLAGKTSYVTRVIQLKNLSAADAEQLIKDIQQRKAAGAAGGRTGGSSARPSGGRSSSGSTVRPPSSGGSGRPSTPAPPPRAPSGGGRSGAGGGGRSGAGGGGGKSPGPGALLLPILSDQPFNVRPAAFLEPLIAITPFSYVVHTQSEPERGASQPDAKAASRALAAPSQAEPERKREAQPATEPVPAPETQPDETATEGLSGVSGALRGEVQAAAIDSQRIVIQGDERDVEFIEQILLMMEGSAPISRIEVFDLKNAKAPVLQPIIEKAVKAWIDARTSKPGPQDKFSINAEAKSNSLIVSASEAIVEQIRDLVERLDVEKAAGVGTDVKNVPLVHMRAAEAVAILRPTIEKLNQLRGEAAKEAQTSIQAVDRNNSVMIIGIPTDIQEVEKWIEALDVELTADQKAASFVVADAIVVQLKNGSADDIAKVLTDMIKAEQEAAQQAGGDRKDVGKLFVKQLKLRLSDGRELPELNLERPIKLIPEKGTNSIIVFSSKENNEALRAILEVFDTLPIGAETDVKVFVLQHASAETVAKLLTDTFKDKSYLGRPSEGDAKSLQKGVFPPVPPGVAAKGLPYPLVVQHDVRSNAVLVIGRTDAVLLAGGLIRELDRPTVDLGLKPHVVALKNAQASQLTEKLKKLLDDRAKALGSDKNAARDNAVIQPDERANALIVLATEEVYDMVEDLVLQLDASEKYSVVDVRYRPLERADAVKLKNMLEEAFKSKADAEKKSNKDAVDSLTVMADPRSNSLLLTGTRDYLAEAERLIAELDQRFDGTVLFRARKVRLNSAVNVASLLREMIEKALTQKDSKLSGTPMHVAADPVSDSLLLAASREDMEVLERWIEILDRPSEVGRMFKIIPLQRAVAEDAAKSVQDIFKGKGGGGQQGGQVDVTVTADKATNSLVAFGPPTLLADIEDLVKRIDDTEPTKGTMVRIFKLEQAAAQDAGELLSRILELRGGSVGGTGGGGSSGSGTKDSAKQVLLIFQNQHPEVGLETLRAIRADVTVISDIRTNSLVITAPADSMPLMESLVAAVDVPPQDAKIRVFRLRNSDAEQMVKMLETLFERKTTGGGGRTSGGDAERVLTLGEGLAGGEGGRQEIAFTTDVRTNSVIAAGTTGYLNLVEEVILQLDTVPIKDRETFVYSPRNIKADALAPSIKDFSDAEQKRLQDIGDDVSIGVKQERQITAIANKDANRVILDVDPRFKESVMNVVRALDQPPPQVMIQVLIVEVTMDNTLDLGVEFAFQDLQYAKAGVNDTTTFDFVGGTDIGAAGSGLGGFTFTITGADFNFLFRTLQAENNLQVLSRPQIVAQDNQKASINITNDVPYVNSTSTTTGGQITTSVSREKIGIKLEVTPQINPDGFVRMEILQEVSDFSGGTVSVGPGVTAPVFFRRETNTTVTVKDNETVVLGGLITSRTENKETKVPLVGDIPGLGLLFRAQTDSAKRTELLIVMTPHVIREIEDYRNLSVAERDQMRVIPPEVLTDPLMQGLQVRPEELEGVTSIPSAEGLVPAETPGESEEGDDDVYGPLRPALRPDARPPANDDSYDVPVSLARTRRP